MRTFLLLGALLVACTNDSFGGGDASTDDGAASDVVIGADSPPIVEAGADALDTSKFAANVLMWLDAADVVATNGLVTSWPDHLSRFTGVALAEPTSATCGTSLGVHVVPNAVNDKPAIAFCDALISISDSSTLRLGSSTFVIEAVMQLTTASTNGIILTKAHTGELPPSDLSFWGRDSAGHLSGSISTSESASNQDTSMSFQYVAFTRLPATTIATRIEGVQGSTSMVGLSDDVSFGGQDYGVGGYVHDTGDYANIFGGELAELIVLKDADSTMLAYVETFLKAKYALP